MFNRDRGRTNRRGATNAPGEFAFSPDGPQAGLPGIGFLDGVFSQGQFPSVIREFVHPGKEPGELLMRCFFKDTREANAAVLYLGKCEEFKLDRHKRLLLHRLASSTSVKGERVKILLQAVTGIVAPSLFGKDGAKDREKD